MFASHLCPSCGTDAKKGVTQCRKCGFDFAAAAKAAPDNEPPQ